MRIDRTHIDLRERLCVLEDGWAMPITNMFDIDGDETEDIELVIRIVAGPTSDGQWITAQVDAFGPLVLN